MKNKHRIFVSIGVILFSIILIAIFAFRQEAQVNQQEQEDPPTPIQLGVMSEKQKKNSIRFNRHKRVRLPDLAQNRDLGLAIGKPFRPTEPPAVGAFPSFVS